MSAALRDFIDDPEVADDDVLLRAVSPELIDDTESFLGRDDEIPSRAWQDQKEDEAAKWGLRPCASVAVARLLSDHECPVDMWLEKVFRLTYGIIQTTAGDVRRAESPQGHAVPQGVMLYPTQDQPWHAVVWSRRGAKRNKTEMKGLLLRSHWVRLPTFGQ